MVQWYLYFINKYKYGNSASKVLRLKKFAHDFIFCA